jgi:hypothetical protein
MLRPGRRGWLAAVGNPLPVSRGSQAVAARLEASSSAQPASKRERSSGGAGLVLPPALPHQEFRRPKRQRRETRKPAVCSGFVCRGRGSNPHAPLRGQLILSRSEGSPTPSGCRAFRLYDRVHTRSAARVSTAFSGSPTVTSLSPSGAATPGFWRLGRRRSTKPFDFPARHSARQFSSVADSGRLPLARLSVQCLRERFARGDVRTMRPHDLIHATSKIARPIKGGPALCTTSHRRSDCSIWDVRMVLGGTSPADY